MSETILVAIISGGLSALASIMAIVITNEKNNALQDERIKTINSTVGDLAKKVEQHNNFGLQLAKLETRVDLLERNR